MGFVGCDSGWQRQFLGGLTVVQFMGGGVCGIGGGFVDGGFVVWVVGLWVVGLWVVSLWQLWCG